MRNLGQYRKALAIAALGLVEVAAYILANPDELPDWVVPVAAVVNVLGVYLAPRNDQPAASRKDLADRVGTRVASEEERPRRRPPLNGP